MKKLIFIATLMLLPICVFSQTEIKELRVYAKTPGWQGKTGYFKKGTTVTISADGGWSSNREYFSYHGHPHKDKRSMRPHVGVMTLVLKITENGVPHYYDFRTANVISHTFEKAGYIYFGCNDSDAAEHRADNDGSVSVTIEID